MIECEIDRLDDRIDALRKDLNECVKMLSRRIFAIESQHRREQKTRRLHEEALELKPDYEQ